MASVPYSFECSKEGGFVMDPNEHKRVGYIINLNGFGLAATLKQDLTVACPFNGTLSFTDLVLTPSTVKGKAAGSGGEAGAGPQTAKVVGVIEKWEWAGGVGDAIKIEFYASQFNAFQIKALQQSTLKTTKVNNLVWWICDYDQETKQWFEQCYPLDKKITGIITGKENPELDVDLTPVVVKDGIDVNVYKITMGIVPAANKSYSFHFANSSNMNSAKAWGLVVGEEAAAALPG